VVVVVLGGGGTGVVDVVVEVVVVLGGDGLVVVVVDVCDSPALVVVVTLPLLPCVVEVVDVDVEDVLDDVVLLETDGTTVVEVVVGGAPKAVPAWPPVEATGGRLATGGRRRWANRVSNSAILASAVWSRMSLRGSSAGRGAATS
jgi:hypothetical protein